MRYCLDFGKCSPLFAVPSAVVDEHLLTCGAASLKALLLLLRAPDQNADIEQMARDLCLEPAEVHAALQYWVQAGLLRADPAEAAASQKEAVPQNPQLERSSDSQTPPAELPKKTPQGPVPKPSKLTGGDIETIIQTNPDVEALLHESERLLCKTLTAADISSIVSLYDWAGIPIDVILMVEEYCKSKGKTNVRYIERTALAWFEKGIDTHEKAERYISELLEASENEKLVRSAFGIYDRRLIPKERDYIHTWFREYGFDIRLIKLAYERTIEAIQKLSFPYINSILLSWHKQGIKTPEAAAGEARIHSTPQVREKPEASYNLNEFEQMMRNSTPQLSNKPKM